MLEDDAIYLKWMCDKSIKEPETKDMWIRYIQSHLDHLIELERLKNTDTALTVPESKELR